MDLIFVGAVAVLLLLVFLLGFCRLPDRPYFEERDRPGDDDQWSGMPPVRLRKVDPELSAKEEVAR